MMWFEVVVGIVLGMSVITGIFWFTFIRIPDRRPEGGVSTSDAEILLRNTAQDIAAPDFSHLDGGQHHP